MTTEMKSEIFKSLDLFDNKEFDYVANMKAFYRIKDFKSIYKEWRQAYIKGKVKTEKINLDNYSKIIASKSRKKVTPEQIKKALLMRLDNYKAKDISKSTGLNMSKIDRLFSNAKLYGLLEIKEKRNES